MEQRFEDFQFPHPVHILRPHFDPSDKLSEAVDSIVVDRRFSRHVKIFGTKRTVLDRNDFHSFRFDTELARADRIFHSRTRPIQLLGKVGAKIVNPKGDADKIRIAMLPEQQTYFNWVVNSIDAVGVEEMDMQPRTLNHYLYFDMPVEALPRGDSEKRMALQTFRETIATPGHFVRPDRYTGYDWTLLRGNEKSPLNDADAPYLDERAV